MLASPFVPQCSPFQPFHMASISTPDPDAPLSCLLVSVSCLSRVLIPWDLAQETSQLWYWPGSPLRPPSPQGAWGKELHRPTVPSLPPAPLHWLHLALSESKCDPGVLSSLESSKPHIEQFKRAPQGRTGQAERGTWIMSLKWAADGGPLPENKKDFAKLLPDSEPVSSPSGC